MTTMTNTSAPASPSMSPRRTSWRVAIVCIPALLAACYHPGVQPRTGDVARRGKVSGGGVLTPYTHAPAEIVDGDGVAIEGDFGERQKFTFLGEGTVGLLMAGELGLGFGLTDRLELGGSLSLHQVEMELRLGVLGERWGDSASVALSAAGRRWFFPGGPGARVGVDASKRFGRAVLLGGLHYSYGPMRYSYQVSSSPESGCGSSEPGLPINYCFIEVDREESRLETVIGLAYDKNGHRLTRAGSSEVLMVALVPYAVLDASSAAARCNRCNSPMQGTFGSDWGVSLVVGGRVWR
jgi:hypothetical protein